ncbi:hypothetical protein J3R30DRAFT_3407874 [Lentinula aciculospora]|uniref:Uncharacterized protein n=1 Tax=Lentinula aciculospora TaxID=153920 RepID=A0A9W9DJ12_9AGAR|nr:hypothetical protein J3R30DRAFT_3407874 [Lentinula aciculospora]
MSRRHGLASSADGENIIGATDNTIKSGVTMHARKCKSDAAIAKVGAVISKPQTKSNATPTQASKSPALAIPSQEYRRGRAPSMDSDNDIDIEEDVLVHGGVNIDSEHQEEKTEEEDTINVELDEVPNEHAMYHEAGLQLEIEVTVVKNKIIRWMARTDIFLEQTTDPEKFPIKGKEIDEENKKKLGCPLTIEGLKQMCTASLIWSAEECGFEGENDIADRLENGDQTEYIEPMVSYVVQRVSLHRGALKSCTRTILAAVQSRDDTYDYTTKAKFPPEGLYTQWYTWIGVLKALEDRNKLAYHSYVHRLYVKALNFIELADHGSIQFRYIEAH